MGDRGRGPDPQESRVGQKHAPYHATLLALPILTVLALSNWSEPLIAIFTVTWLAMFVIFLWAILKMERSLNSEGESLFYPWRVPSTRKETRRIDGVLATSIRRLKSGEDEEDVLSSLRLQVEGKLPREADRHYARAVERLEEASKRDWVFDAERRRRDLGEAEREPSLAPTPASARAASSAPSAAWARGPSWDPGSNCWTAPGCRGSRCRPRWAPGRRWEVAP